MYGETVVTMSVRNSYFNTSYEYGTEDGLQFAFAITAYDGNRSITEDPDIGLVKAKIVSWGIAEDAQGVVNDLDGGMPLYTCSRAELGLDEEKLDQSLFYPIRENSYRDIETYSEKLQCIDKKFILQGDYNSSKARHF